MAVKDKASVCLYAVLVWIRWIASTGSGYIHPDEYFQNPEITSRIVFGIESFVPWEFTAEHAARSIVPPFLLTGVPFQLTKIFGELSGSVEQQVPSAVSIFLIERLACFILSLMIDYAVYRVCQQTRRNPWLPLNIIGASQVMLVYYVRPFSNTIEAAILCFCLKLFTSCFKGKIASSTSFGLGTLLVLGIFTRITFILYGVPVGVGYLYMVFKKSSGSFSTTLKQLVPFILGASICFVLCVFADSVYYQALQVTFKGMQISDVKQFIDIITNPVQWQHLRVSGRLVLTPLNNILYNANVENLKQHGLHPRYLHLLVHYPMLYGPLSLGIIRVMLAKAREGLQDNGYRPFYYVLVATIATSMAGLSAVPHQEARFLTPMLVPMTLLYTWDDVKPKLLFWLAWPMFNIIMTYMFGVLHQGGIVQAMMYLQQQSLGVRGCRELSNGDLFCNFGTQGEPFTNEYNVTTHLVFHKTYMPPRHLLGYSMEWKDHAVNIDIQDFAGNAQALQEQLQLYMGVMLPELSHGPHLTFAPTGGKHFERTLLIAPSATRLPRLENHRYLLLASFGPHVNFDDIGWIVQSIKTRTFSSALLGLNVYLVLSEEGTM
ncbi:hypothetical protein VTP01DRAFT_7591, partial [Rhizomucor pusillus]|uniref:uncharacterized protein n=1 Tax=Rhizomucor pusillus TaxID=4840 RepID=UPI003744A768